VQTVLVRDGKSNDQKLIRAKLTDLVSNKAFNGKYFKVVLGKSNKPIGFDHKDSKILLKAATTYYHATIARNFFIEKLKSDYVKKLGQVTLRLEITSTF